MYQRFLPLLGFFLGVACAQTSPISPTDSVDFEKQVEQFFKEYWDKHPGQAAQEGLTAFDGILEIPTQEVREAKLKFYKDQLEAFEKVSARALSPAQKSDRSLLINEMKKRIWYIEALKSYQWNPAAYNLAPQISQVMEKRHRPLEDRLQDALKKLEKAAEYYIAAQAQIQKPTREHLNLAIQQTQGTLTYLRSELPAELKKAKWGKKQKRTFQAKTREAQKATQTYLSFLKQTLRNPQPVGGFSDFRIGPELYRAKFDLDLQIDLTPEQLYRRALSAKEEARSRMFELAIELYPKFYGEKLPPKDRQEVMKAVISKVTAQHAKPQEFVNRVREQIPQLIEFIRKKDLVSLDSDKPLVVRETPSYQGGFGVASVDSPGPFDPLRGTFYNVTPLKEMSTKQQQSFLREYNDYSLQILNIHEAVPGHYVQLVHSNKAKSLVKSIFGNTPMVEGWAVYAERMMLEEGYGENSPELWLMYYKWFLRVVTNTILDYEIHNKNLSRAQALKLMQEDAFQEKTEAEGKWTRATLSQIQLLSYFAGFSEIYSLREEIKEKQAEKFNLKEFHESFLSFGSAPIREIKKLMLAKSR